MHGSNMAKKPDLKSPELYINRELSWLEFNDRVLREGLRDDVPLLERLKFLAIVSSNLDEYFMIRVAGLVQQHAAGVRRPDVSGMTPPPNWPPSASGPTAWSPSRPPASTRSSASWPGTACGSSIAAIGIPSRRSSSAATSPARSSPCSRRWRSRTWTPARSCRGCGCTLGWSSPSRTPRNDRPRRGRHKRGSPPPTRERR